MRSYEELGWESLNDRKWCRRLCLFHKILNGITPSYLVDFIPQRSNISLNLRNRNLNIACRTARYSNSFFPFCITNWNSLDDFPPYRSLKATSLSLSNLQGSISLEYVIELVANGSLKLE